MSLQEDLNIMRRRGGLQSGGGGRENLSREAKMSSESKKDINERRKRERGQKGYDRGTSEHFQTHSSQESSSDLPKKFGESKGTISPIGKK